MSNWRKSSYSGGNNDCIEVAGFGLHVLVRDTKTPEMGRLSVPSGQWRAFVTSVKHDAL